MHAILGRFPRVGVSLAHPDVCACVLVCLCSCVPVCLCVSTFMSGMYGRYVGVGVEVVVLPLEDALPD